MVIGIVHGIELGVVHGIEVHLATILFLLLLSL